MLHRLILKKYGKSSSNFISPKNLKNNLIKMPVFPNQDLHYHEKIHFINKTIGYESPDLNRGITDEYRRFCKDSEFTEPSIINKVLVTNILNSIEFSSKIVSSGEIFIITDLAYSKHRAIKYYCAKDKKKLFILNPHGEFRNVTHFKDSDADPSGKEFTDLREVERKSNNYKQLVQENFNKIIYDGNELIPGETEPFIENQLIDTRNLRGKKILYLHCLRDAANLPIKINKIEDLYLSDYFLWADEMFSIIGSEPESWFIKKHPASVLYGEEEILANLAYKHDIPTEIFLPENYSRSKILQSKAPIFTHSGTIAMESAGFGQKSICVKGKYNDRISYNLSSISEIQQVAKLSASEVSTKLTISRLDSFFAKELLYLWKKTFVAGSDLTVNKSMVVCRSYGEKLRKSLSINILFIRLVLKRKVVNDFEIALEAISNE
jgi:hypothetical protein